MPDLDNRLLEVLACPACHGDVHQEDEWIVCEACGRRYPVKDGLPFMLVEEAVVPGQEGPTEAKGEEKAGAAGES